MKRLIIFSTILLLGCAESILSVQPEKIPLDNVKSQYDVYGYYYLPKTILKIRVPIYKKTYLKGIVHSANTSSCLAKYLKTNYGWEPTKVPDELVGIEKGATMTTLYEPDPEKRYALLYKNSKSISQTINISLNKDGIIQSGEFAQESQVFDITKKSIELVGTAVGTLGKLGPADSYTGIAPCAHKGDIQLSNRSKLLVERLEELSKAKFTLLSSYPVSVNNPEVQKFHQTKIEGLIKEIKGELMGKIKKKIHYVTLYIDPKKDFNSLNLFHINTKEGIVDSGANSLFKNLTNNIKSANLSNTKTLKLIVQKKLVPNQKNTLYTEASLKNSEDGHTVEGDAFLYYNIPAKYTLTLGYGGKPLKAFSSKEDKKGTDDFDVYFPQLGAIGYLGIDFKEANITYYEDTGGLKSAKTTKDAAITAERVEGLYSAVDSIIRTGQAIKEKRENEKKEALASEEETEEEIDEQIIRLIIDNNSSLQADTSN